MTVYVDQLHKYESGEWCHLWSDSIDELETFARGLFLKKEWRQMSVASDGTVFIHYDLRKTKRQAAIKNGATETRLGDWLKAKRNANRIDNIAYLKNLFDNT